ncbi:integrase core domain-containing protein [Thermodesulfobacteriota bacterium]
MLDIRRSLVSNSSYSIRPFRQWRNLYNTIRPHSSLNYQPPAPQALLVNHTESAQGNSSPVLIH